MSYRIGIGRIWHESNSFFSVRTNLEDFQSYPGGLVVGEALFGRPDRADEVTGMLDVFSRDERFEPVPLLGASLEPSGAIAQDCVVALRGILRGQLQTAGELDAICFSLHGAMTGETIADLDGYFLQVMRDEVGARIPIVCSLDCHATVTRQMIRLSTALVAYRTHPHTDVVETGQRAAEILIDAISEKTNPVTCMQKIPLLLLDRGTESSPIDRLFEKFIGWDDLEGVIACSLCPAYPLQDVPQQGWTAIAVTDNDEELAQRLVAELASEVWAARHELLPEPMLPPVAALQMAIQMPGFPILVTDSADNVGAGAPGDTTGILKAVIETYPATDGLVLANFPDAQVTEIAETGQVGETITIDVAGKSDIRYGHPVSVTAKILAITGGEISDDGRFSGNLTIDAGVIICLGIDNLRLVLSEHAIWGPQPSLFRKVGIDPFEAKIVVVKSGIGYKVTYGSVAKGVVHADCPGPGSRNFAHFDFQQIPRPMFPLDGDIATLHLP
jgi:microcystin degradation protein MlrC